MVHSEIINALGALEFERDERLPPDHWRRAHFRAGWEDAANRHLTYDPAAFRRLTWRNLGHRLGTHAGAASRADIDEVFDRLAADYDEARPLVPGSSEHRDWRARTPEDRLLEQYWGSVGERIFTEVPLAGASGPPEWRHGSTTRRIDGVRVPAATGGPSIVRHHANAMLFRESLRNARFVEIIEVKPRLNRPVIGQVLAGVDLFAAQYGREGDAVVVCGKGDGALEWACERRSVAVWLPPGT